MKLFNWARFTWDLTKLPLVGWQLPEHYQVAAATTDDERELRNVFSRSFLLDPTWNPAIGEVMQTIQSWLTEAFASDSRTCLALRHGVRIIGGIVLSLDPEADSHLAPGPCILIEYRNRGFGTYLLENSLGLLREAGLARATAIAPAHAPVAKFLYPKCNALVTAVEMGGLLAA
jgi:hypothetical protein